MIFAADEQYVKVNGRTLYKDGIRYLGYSCSGIEFYFTGSRVEASLWSNSPSMDENHKAWIAVFVDDELVPSKRIKVDKEEGTYLLYEGDTVKKTKIRLVKYSEASAAKIGIKSIIIDSDIKPEPVKSKTRKIEFIGDSITCGYGDEGSLEGVFTTAEENPWEAYAAKTARALDADFNLVSWSGIGIISSYTEEDVPNDSWLMPSLYKYTDKAMDLTLGNKKPQLWDNKSFIPDCIVINLGTNDHSYVKNIAERAESFGRSYNAFVRQVHESNPSTKILCTLGVMGQDLCNQIEKQVALLSDDGLKDVYYLKFDIQDEKDGLGTYWHPSLATHAKMAVKLEQKIREIMNW